MASMIKNFLIFNRFINELDVKRLDERLKTRIASEDGTYEKQINEVLLYNLSKKIIRGEITGEFADGFKSALLLRSSLKSLENLGVLTKE